MSFSVVDAMRDGHLFAPAFPEDTWGPWQTALAATFGLELTPEQVELFRRCTGRQEPPTTQVREAWFPIGRRGGKSRIASLIAVYAACFKEHRLSRGEQGTVLLLAADRSQAKVALRYVDALVSSCAMLEKLVVRRTANAIDFANNISIQIATSNYRTIRGRTTVCAVLDEVCFWQTDSAAENPDSEIVAALLPSMSTVPDPLLVAISSVHSKRGIMFERWRDHFGRDDSDVLVWLAESRVMNPSLPQRVVDQAISKDPERARAEYLSIWRADVSAFIPRDVIEGCVARGVREIPPDPKIGYSGFVDVSGGRSDSAALAIVHREQDGRIILDCLREIPAPHDPHQAAAEFARVLATYSITRLRGDRYSGSWVSEAYRRHGIRYESSEKSKSELYVETLPLLNSGLLQLLDIPKLVGQFAGLERTVARGSGRETIDHGPGGHDDLCNAVAGAAYHVPSARAPGDLGISIGERGLWLPGDHIEVVREREHQRDAALLAEPGSLEILKRLGIVTDLHPKE